MGCIIRYNHHGIEVAVQSHLRGRHREHCLCSQCALFPTEGTPLEVASEIEGQIQPIVDWVTKNHPELCPKASILYAYCQLFGLTTPVWECPDMIAQTRKG